MGDSTVRSMQKFRHFPFASVQQEFQNVQYVPVEGLNPPIEECTTPTNVVLHFRKNYHL